jgi:cytochrome c5
MKIRIYIILIIIAFYIASCSKNSGSQSANLYEPATADVTANATLAQLQQGKSLFIANCNACHQLYSPDDFAASDWKIIISKMAGRTSLNATQISLITKYVSRGK